MKKCIILALAAICVACENYIEIPDQSDAKTSITKQSIGATENLRPLMVAFPGKEKKLFETNSGILLEQYDTCYIYQGDIILSKRQFEILNQQQAPGTRGAIITTLAQYWPDCTVYYEFHPDFEGKAIARIAMDSISSRTGVKFIKKSDPTQDCIYFFHGEGNHSSLGRQGGMQSISIQHGCNQQSFWEVFAHEILHALGIQHEMARYDRDDYIDIYWDNIIPSKAFAFQKYIDSGTPGDDVSRFNANSIMMYDSYAFGKEINGKTQITISKKDGTLIPYWKRCFAKSDISALQSIYGQPYALEKTIITDKSIVDGDYIYVDIEEDVKLNFCKDEYLFFLIETNTWRYFNVEITNVFNGKTSVRNELIVIPPGTISYNIGKGRTTYRLGNWGSKSNYSSTKYRVTNVNFRQSVKAEDLPIPIPYDPKNN